MPATSRISDLTFGVCSLPHPVPHAIIGMQITGSTNVITNGLMTTRVTDIELGMCGSIGIHITGSPNVNANSLPVHRMFDVFAGTHIGLTVSGSPDVNKNSQ